MEREKIQARVIDGEVHPEDLAVADLILAELKDKKPFEKLYGLTAEDVWFINRGVQQGVSDQKLDKYFGLPLGTVGRHRRKGAFGDSFVDREGLGRKGRKGKVV